MNRMNLNSLNYKNFKETTFDLDKLSGLKAEEYTHIRQQFMPLAKEISDLKKMVEYMKTTRFEEYMQNWVNGEAVIKALGISKRTLQNYRNRGVLSYSQVGKKILYRVEDINHLLEKNYKKN